MSKSYYINPLAPQDAPCHGCKTRSMACHGICPEYKAFSAKCREAGKNRSRQSLIQEFYNSTNYERLDYFNGKIPRSKRS